MARGATGSRGAAAILRTPQRSGPCARSPTNSITFLCVYAALTLLHSVCAAASATGNRLMTTNCNPTMIPPFMPHVCFCNIRNYIYIMYIKKSINIYIYIYICSQIVRTFGSTCSLLAPSPACAAFWLHGGTNGSRAAATRIDERRGPPTVALAILGP